MKKLAVIIPSIKPYEISCRLVVDSIIKSIKKNPICQYDIFIHGPNNPNDDRVNFIEEKNQVGENIAINNVVKSICNSYDYYFLTADDHIVSEDSNLLESIDFLNSPVFNDRKMKICTLATKLHSPCYSLEYLPFPDGSPYGKVYNPDNSFILPEFIICRFPFMSKDTLNNYLNNRIFPENINSGYGDSCLSYFLYKNNEPCLELPSVKLEFLDHIHNLDRISRWKPEWIELRSKSCISAYNFLKNYNKNDKYI